MTQSTGIKTIHNINQRKALKDFLLSRVSAADLKDRVQLFEEREHYSDQAPVDANLVALRKSKLLEALGEVNKKQAV